MALTQESALRKDRTNADCKLEHRHFAFIAATIAALEGDDVHHFVAEHFADACARTNPRFDRARFLVACKV